MIELYFVDVHIRVIERNGNLNARDLHVCFMQSGSDSADDRTKSRGPRCFLEQKKWPHESFVVLCLQASAQMVLFIGPAHPVSYRLMPLSEYPQ